MRLNANLVTHVFYDISTFPGGANTRKHAAMINQKSRRLSLRLFQYRPVAATITSKDVCLRVHFANPFSTLGHLDVVTSRHHDPAGTRILPVQIYECFLINSL